MGRSEGLARTRLFHAWGASQRGVVRLLRSVSHVVGHGHLLTSGWVPLGPIRGRRGSSGTRMGPYLSRTPIRVHRVFRQGSLGPVGPDRPHRPKFGQVQKHQIWFEMGRESPVWPMVQMNPLGMNTSVCSDLFGLLLRPQDTKLLKMARP